MWKIVLWGEKDKQPVQKWLDSLDGAKLAAIAGELSLLELSGNLLKLPHSRSLGEGLFELRERAFGLRLYYCFDKGKIIILLQAGNKQSQEKDIRTAHKRLKSTKKG
jgi:putative addiction module killer protein